MIESSRVDELLSAFTLQERDLYFADALFKKPDGHSGPEREVVFTPENKGSAVVDDGDDAPLRYRATTYIQTVVVADQHASPHRQRPVSHAETVGCEALAACRESAREFFSVEARASRLRRRLIHGEQQDTQDRKKNC